MAADLKAKLDLETAGFDKGVQNAESKTKLLKNTAEQASSGVDKLASAESKAAREAAKLAMSQERAKKQVKEFNNSLGGLTSGLNGMMNAMNSGSITGMVSSLLGLLATVGSLTGGISGLGAALSSTLLSPVGLAIGAVGALGALFVGSAKAAETFEVSVRQLAALTGATGEELQALKDAALDLSDKTGKSASDIVDSFKLIGSQAPLLLQDREGLVAVTDAAITLSKAANMEVVDAGKAITTAMNGMGIAAEDTGHVIDAMAKAALLGAGDIEYISKAMEKSGSIAAGMGISFDEATAAIEQIALKESSADVAGSLFRSTLIKLSVAENDAFNPEKAGGLKEALDNIANSGMSTADMLKLVGESNLATLQNLVATRDALGLMDKALLNADGTAQSMAETQAGLASAFNKVKVAWNNFLIKLGESSAVQEAINMIKDMCLGLADWIKENDWLVDAIGVLFKVLLECIKIAFTPFKVLLSAIGHIVNVVKNAINILCDDGLSPLEKTVLVVTEVLRGLVKIYRTVLQAVRDVSAYIGLGDIMDWVMNKFEEAVKFCKNLWKEFLEWLGIKSDEVEVKTPKPKKSDAPKSSSNENTNTETSSTSSSTKTTKSGRKTGKKTETYTPAKGSLGYLENKLSELQKKYKDGLELISPEEYKKRVAELEQQIKDKKIEMGIEPKVDESTLKQLEAQLKKLKDDQLGVNAINADDYKEQVKKLEDKIKQEKIRLGVDLSVENVDLKLKEATAGKKTSSFDAAVNPILGEDNSKTLLGIQEQMDANDALLEKLKEIQQAYKDLGIAGEEGYNKVSAAIDEVNENQTKLGNDAQVLAKQDKQTKKLAKDFQNAGTAITLMGLAFSSLGSAFESPELNIAGTIAQSIASIISGYGSAVALASTMGPWAWLAFSAAAMAQVGAMVAAISSYTSGTEGYATGGIVSGSTTVGDSVLTRLNAGELVLNTRQLAHLFDMLNNGVSINSSPSNAQVEFRISGKELVGVLSNYNISKSKIL